MRRTQWIESLTQDIRFGIRTFRKRPIFALTVLAILAFGVGSASAIFSIVNGVLLKALPYRSPENLVRIYGVGSMDSARAFRRLIFSIIGSGIRHLRVSLPPAFPLRC